MAHATRAALVRSQNASRGHARGCLATVTDRAEACYQRRARTNSTALRAREGIIKLPSKLLSYRRPTTRLDRPFRMKPQNAHRTTLPIRGGWRPTTLPLGGSRPTTHPPDPHDRPPTHPDCGDGTRGNGSTSANEANPAASNRMSAFTRLLFKVGSDL